MAETWPMAEQDGEFGEFIRQSLHAATESVMIGHDGLDRIYARLAAVRLAGDQLAVR